MKKVLSITAVILAVIAVFLLAGCGKESIGGNLNIKYGTSFGMCVGYCFNELTVTQNGLSIRRINRAIPTPKICTKPLTSQQWQELRNKINVEKFNKLDTVYGCPDCADGGAEWIEIQQGTSKKKVTFDYHKEPEAVKLYIEILRNHAASFSDCK